MEMLRIFVRALGYGNVEIARLSRIPHANVGRYFRGEARVPLDFVVAVVRALGLDYREFFELAYADRPAEPTAARQKIERILQVLPARGAISTEPGGAAAAAPPEQVEPLPRPEIEKMLEDLRRDVKALLDARQADKAIVAEPEPEPKARPKKAKPAPAAKKRGAR